MKSNNAKERLALMGGEKTIHTPFKRYNSIGEEEVELGETWVLGCFELLC